MQRNDEVVVCVVPFGALDCLHAEVSNGAERGIELAIEDGRLRPGETDCPENGSVEPVERQRRGRLRGNGARAA